jgi:hypothetical protein
MSSEQRLTDADQLIAHSGRFDDLDRVRPAG